MGIVRRNHGSGHSYAVDGERYDGVTGLIRDGLPKPQLVPWAARVTAQYVADNFDALAAMRDLPYGGADEIALLLGKVHTHTRNRAAARGTQVHVLAAQLAAGDEVEVPDELIGHVESCARFLDEWHVDVHAVETVVCSRTYRYAGTLDVVADITSPTHGVTVRALLDYKTSASGIFTDTAYQLAAYRHADVTADEVPMSEYAIEAGFAVWLRADGYDVVPVACDATVFTQFLAIAEVARIAHAADHLIGEAVV